MRIVLVTVALSLAGSAQAQLSRPVGCSGCIANWYYFDNNGGAAGSQDWSCASSSYDGHRGSDFSLAGGNGAIAGGHSVVATADGVVESAQDGHYDRCTACGGSGCGTAFGYGYGNHIVVNHGSIKVIYAHLRTGSVRVGPGDTVTCGQTIGEIGSSGCSTGAHLHLETRPLGASSSSAYDPFDGSCSAGPSRWNDQGPHRGMPGATCGPPPPPPCPEGTYPIWTCEGNERVRCIDGDVMREVCPLGCVSMPTGTDDVCASSSCDWGSEWTCDGNDRVRCAGGAEERESCPVACSAGACSSAPVDADMDGHNTSVDCDDANPAVYPGADDPCGDGVDANCDGVDACPGDDAGTDADLPDGAIVLDGGPGSDAGVGVDDPPRVVVGGCAASGGGSPAGLLVLLLALRRRR